MTNGDSRNVTIVGAGLVGSLCSIYLAKRGYAVTVFESRSDMRREQRNAGRSINLALSTRGIRALDEIGLADAMKSSAVPMTGRMMHSVKGALTFQPYGENDQYINSISRSGLNIALLNEAEKQGVRMHFDHRLERFDRERNELTFESAGSTITHRASHLVGADGMFSAVREALSRSDDFDFAEYPIEHGYKELRIPSGSELAKNALHIWPRQSFMLIALPNTDSTFTATLFLPFEGELSFARLQTPKQIRSFFKKTFPDVLPLMPSLVEDFQSHPTSSLITIRCYPWAIGNILLLGDAAHGIVPFYGQGMNAGFEDCRIFNHLLDKFEDNWKKAGDAFQQLRKPDADAIAHLALDNFIEMRDLVGNRDFLLRKKIEARLHELFPTRWIPLYHMVTFDDHIRYSEAYETGRRQRRIMDQVMNLPDIQSRWKSLNFEEIVNQLAPAVKSSI